MTRSAQKNTNNFDFYFASTVVQLFKPRGISCVVPEMVWWEPTKTGLNYGAGGYYSDFWYNSRTGVSIQRGHYLDRGRLLFRKGIYNTDTPTHTDTTCRLKTQIHIKTHTHMHTQIQRDHSHHIKASAHNETQNTCTQPEN